MKNLFVMFVVCIALSGCTTVFEDIFKPDEKIVYVKVPSKPKTKTIVRYKTIPVPSERPSTEKIDIDPYLSCPEFQNYPDPKTLTNQEVVDVLKELKSINDLCHSNMEYIKRAVK